MTESAIWTYLQWLLSAATIVFTVLAGKRHWTTWWVAIFVQVLWSFYIVATKQWGLMPMNVVLWVLYIRNLILWRRYDRGNFRELTPQERAAYESFKTKQSTFQARYEQPHY